MKIKYLSFAIMVLSIFSCEDIPTNIDIVTHLLVYNDQNENLLDPTTIGCYKEEEIKLYYLKNGVKEEVYNVSYNWPRNFDIFKVESTDDYAMVLVPLEGKNNGEITTTVIKWSDQDEDTVKTEMIRFETNVNVTSISKIWFNDKLLYDDQVNGKSPLGNGYVERLITIRK
jgi:hypothetical protein